MGDKKAKQGQVETRALDDCLKKFLLSLKGLKNSLPIVMYELEKQLAIDLKEQHDFIKRKCKKTAKNKYNIPVSDYQEFTRKDKKIKTSLNAVEILPCSFIVTLVSLYDGFLGNLIRNLIILKPEILKGSQKSMIYSDITNFENIEQIREYLIEKTVEEVLRDSHVDHFDWMENNFNIKLREGLEEWPIFIELTERRNLFVHCNGKVSHQYLDKCRSGSVVLGKDVKLGLQLQVTPEYFINAYRCVFQLGVKLQQVLRRKLFPDDLETADMELNEIGYDLLIEEDYFLAEKIFEFSNNVLKKHAKEENRKILLINHAIAYKFSGNQDLASKIIESEDWSGSESKFRLAVAVLKDNKKESCRLMLSIGKSAELPKRYYKEWPLFKEFRKTKEFQDTYRKIFKESYSFNINIPKNKGEIYWKTNKNLS